MTRAHLAIVAPQPERVDIYRTWRADIAKRDWGRVMIEGDRNPPVYIADGKGGWR